MKYDIFISYRRKGGYESAQQIAQYLKTAGYNVFFDLEALRESGKFNEKLFAVIDGCKDFVIIFPKETTENTGRLKQQDDWVRLELAYALKQKKNIVPVLLRNFTFPKDLPEDIREVQFYQGVAAGDWNYFDASMQKLRELLKSKRGITFRRYKYFFLSLIAVVLICGAFFSCRYYQNRKLLVATCVEQSKYMSRGIAIINENLNLAHDAYQKWCKFYPEFISASPKDTSRIRKDFLSYLHHVTRQILERDQLMKLSDESSSILRKNGIEFEEISAFYELVLPNYSDEVGNYISALETYSKVKTIYESFSIFVDIQNQYLTCSAKVDYYSLLGLFSTMPDEVFVELKKVHPELNNFREISISLSKDEYNVQSEAMLAECERLISEMTGVTNQDQLTVETMEKALEQTVEEMKRTILGDKLLEQQEKRTKIEKGNAEIVAAEKQLAEVYESALKKFAISPDDEQGLMWGKMLRVATLAHQAQIQRKEANRMYDEQVKIAESQGLDASFLTKMVYTYSVDDMYQNVYKWLDTYQKYNVGSERYVSAAKGFYKAVRKEAIPYQGVMMVATKDDAHHPVLEIGDVIVERKGHQIKDVDHYFSLKDNPAENTVKILRFSEDGKYQFLTKTIPVDCTVLVALVDLTEEL